MAEQFARRSGVPFVGLRISNIMEPPDYARFPTWQDDPLVRKWNLWGYVDARDVASAVVGGLTADVRGATVCIVAAADTCMTRDSADLMTEVFPDVPFRRAVDGRETLLAIDRARELLGYEPQHTWQAELRAAGTDGATP
jgi:nucleoside-diphosphate-sugar epimerase